MNLLNALIVLNESALTIEQIAGLTARLRNGDVPTEEELDRMVLRNNNFVVSELERLEADIARLKEKAR